MLKCYMRIRLFSHWRICFSWRQPISGAPARTIGRSCFLWSFWFCLASPLPHCFLLFFFFSLHITERLNFYKSYIRKTFLSSSWWKIRRARTPGLPRMENSIWDTNWLSWRLVHEQTLPWNSDRRGRFREKVMRNPSHRIWSFSFWKRMRPRSNSIPVVISEL